MLYIRIVIIGEFYMLDIGLVLLTILLILIDIFDLLN